MHELSIVMNIVEIVEENLQQSGAKAVTEIELEIGSLSGVVIEALEFALEEGIKNTILEHARKNIIKIPGRARCNKCSHEFDVDDLFTPCPECSSFDSTIMQGEELRIKSIVVE
ncbi:MAG: hydrogenase maturation nickel metallochaperone HypA [Bacteroidales bacterium]|nr:hydrogenase maturation nickel metallochaperone HypA [Bacteroidales bacterium]